jgi:hypothetical protein
MTKRLSSLLSSAVVLLFSLSAHAGTIAIDPGQPTFTPGGAFSNNTIAAQVVNGNLLQIFGATNIAVTPGGSATISVTGTYNANGGDIVSFFYNFGINLSSSVPVTFTLQATANTPFGPINAMDSGSLMQGDHQYTGMGQTIPAPFSFSGTYTASLTFDFGSPAKGGSYVNGIPTNSMFLSIPTNGLEFQLAPTAVPEPSTCALVISGVGALLLIARRRHLA